jgi:hypothetical protein
MVYAAAFCTIEEKEAVEKVGFMGKKLSLLTHMPNRKTTLLKTLFIKRFKDII